ncbi:MAG TPA: hypothetical protein VGV65_03970 [Nocardioides sp.]|nr:hypothetical protein [Nocardioides sp.]
MESMPTPDPDSMRAELAAADVARQRLSGRLRLPAGILPVLGVGIAVQIGTAAVGIARQTTAGMALVGVGLVVLLAVVAWTLLRFRQVNGVRVDGFASQVVLWTGGTATGAYVAGFVGATWAAFESVWWLVAVASVVGGVGYALAVRQWWEAFRADPASRSAGASPKVLALLAAGAVVGLAVLVATG